MGTRRVALRQAPNVTVEPRVDLAPWAVFETQRGERHVAGINRARGAPRVSSAIVDFDPDITEFATVSGRIYQVHDIPSVPDEVRFA